MDFILIVLILATFFITAKICKVINRNTFGTTGAYVRRYIIVWAIVFIVLAFILEGLGLMPEEAFI